MEFRHPRKIINPHPSQNRLNGTRVETANEMESFIMKKTLQCITKRGRTHTFQRIVNLGKLSTRPGNGDEASDYTH